MEEPIREIFANLDNWRHLPNYQLERRFDVFLTPYLLRIVQAHTNVALDPTIVPEMPLKQERTNLSDKADYVLFSADRRTAYLIELKTDCASIRAEQIAYLDRCCATPWCQTLDGLIEVARASQQRRKYIHLLSLLARAEQVRLQPDLLRIFSSGTAVRLQTEWVEVVSEVESVETIFITPTKQDPLRCISFADSGR